MYIIYIINIPGVIEVVEEGVQLVDVLLQPRPGPVLILILITKDFICIYTNVFL